MEEAVGPGGGLPSYRRDPAKILRDLSLLLQVGLAYFSGAFDQVLRSRKIERGEMANRQTRRRRDVIHVGTRRVASAKLHHHYELITPSAYED